MKLQVLGFKLPSLTAGFWDVGNLKFETRSLKLETWNLKLETLSPGKIMKRILLMAGLFLFATSSSQAQQTLDNMIDRDIDQLVATYKTLHAAPELSHYEEKTSALFAARLRSLGYEVTEGVGKYDRPDWRGHGVVAVMKNGEGPTLLVRTDLDALPVEEKTGLPYASTVKAKNDAGQDVGVMHACGHDVHITSMLGTAKMLAQLKDQWRGTLVLIGQPAE